MHEEEHTEEFQNAEGEESSAATSPQDEPLAVETVDAEQPFVGPASAEIDPPYARPAKPRSWSAAALAVVALLVLADYAIVQLGTEYYWPLITMYFTSLMARFVVLIICLYVIERQLPERTTEARIVAALIGGLAGGISSIARFVGEQNVWTFFNLITEPIDMMVLALLALAGARIVSKQFNKKQLTTHV